MCSVPTCKKCGTDNVKKLLSAPSGAGNGFDGMHKSGKVDPRAALI
jgi:hypothetical protein